jgi:hypothetical protein
MKASFNINFTQGEPIGILMYELKNIGQFNNNSISSEYETIQTQLFMVWKINNSKEFCVYSQLIEHDKGRVWDRDRLMKLAKHHQLYDIQ